MKHAVFFGDAGRIGYVYAPQTVEKLRASLCFEVDRPIAKSEMDEYRDVLSRADYLFTTWGMPHFEREEIRTYLPNLKAIFYGAGSVQYFAREFLAEGIAVFSAWAANGVPVEMAKTSAALAKLGQKRLPFISVLTDPTTGGVAASFAMLGDVIIAEPNALIGFAGPRVIEQTIRQQLPKGFQLSEFLLKHGMVDMVVERKNLKDTIIKIIKFFVFKTK